MLRRVSIAFIVLSIFISSLFLYQKEEQSLLIKSHLIELSKAKYGVFNVDEWKEIVSEIVVKKIDEFQFTTKEKGALERKIAEFLYKAIDTIEAGVKANRFSSVQSFFQNAVSWGSDLFGRLRNDIPNLSKVIVEDLEKPETRNSLKAYINSLIQKYAQKTFSEVDYSLHDHIIYTYRKDSKEATIKFLKERQTFISHGSFILKMIIYTCCFGLSMVLLSSKTFTKFELSLSLLAALCLLILGLTLPMIDIDARISSFSFKVLGEAVDFENQVLYFKSKSILEVVVLMISQGKWDILFVGLLVFVFSVIFPLLKLLATLFHIGGKNGRWVHFFVFKSGKWSMADVLVVAIFMSYIGFSSILTEQLSQLNNLSDQVQILTTNESVLNTGFFMFFGFVVLGLIISDRLKSTII